ncbi:sensor histidine kinase [Nocardia sp. CDC159]|uniref:histidine kinase n=1 Tax=Nocardia pulmonis TaxID=2951408 RepID=A0A9X2EA95_9NOCA|nr:MULTISPECIES: sensor histidine kinase [Nocardia]MCM6776510.1 sensor histidine kinase [Nocardia pulmonis]MCM6788934.1 sensor histidine kinase [Nocardia sp. CDC159]
MNQSTAVTISWILAAFALLAVAAALGAAFYAVQQRARAARAERELDTRLAEAEQTLHAREDDFAHALRAREDELDRALQVRDDELEHFAANTIGYVADAVRRAESPVELQIGGDDRFARTLQSVADRFAEELRAIADDTEQRVRAEAEYATQQAVSAAQANTRAELETSSREATSAAVRAFGTSVVSLGADVSQVVSAALRAHRGDEVYETLTRIDHSVQQMIRQAQSYVIVCGGLPGRRWPQQTLTDVVGGAVGRVRDFTRVRPHQLDRVVISRAVEPLVHTLATLLDNALRYSPPTSFVDVTFQEGHHGVTVIVDDAGVRMNAEQMEDARQVLAGEKVVDIHALGPSPRVGFPGIAALARRYGFTVYIDGPNAYGGMRAMVYIPEALLAQPAAPKVPAELTAPPQPAALAAAGENAATPAVSEPAGRPRPTVVPATAETASDAPTALPRRTAAAPVAGISSSPVPSAELTRPTAVPEPAGDPTPTLISAPVAPIRPAPEPTTDASDHESTVHDITPGGLPRRRRRTVAVSTLTRGSRTDTELPRTDIAAAWHSGSQSGRAAAFDHTEGMTS